MSSEESQSENFTEVTVVIPAFNEAEGISAALSSLCRALPGSEILVVDDGSTDETAAQVMKFPQVTLIRHDFNRGYGGAIKSGLRAATRDFVAWFDADNEHKADLLKNMLRLIESKNLAAVLGERDSSTTPVRGAGKLAIRMVARLLSIRSGSDLNCGLRVFRRAVISPYIQYLPNGYSASLTSTIILVENQFPFEFYPITVNPRVGKSKVSLPDGFSAFLLVFRVVTLFAPMRIFLPVGGGFSLLGLGYSLLVAFREGSGFPVLGATVVLTGVLIMMLGLVADQISQIRLSEIDRPPH